MRASSWSLQRTSPAPVCRCRCPTRAWSRSRLLESFAEYARLFHVGTRACAGPSRRIMIRLAQPIMIGWVVALGRHFVPTGVEIHYNPRYGRWLEKYDERPAVREGPCAHLTQARLPCGPAMTVR